MIVERGLNLAWVLIGAGAAAEAWRVGLSGPGGPDSGMFPFIAGVVVCLAGDSVGIYNDGVFSHVNQSAMALGARPGQRIHEFVAALLARARMVAL